MNFSDRKSFNIFNKILFNSKSCCLQFT